MLRVAHGAKRGLEALSIARPVCLELSPNLMQKSSGPQPSKDVVSLDPSVFNHPIRRDILYLCVNHIRDGLRQGTASTKTRAEVRGSGRKIMQQKGTGKARVGDAQSPIRRGGGVAFGPKPRDFSTKLPRKVMEMGMRVALSAKVKEENLGVMTELLYPVAKTKHLAQVLNHLGMRRCLLITGEEKPCVGLERAISNIPENSLARALDVDIMELLSWERVILDLKAVDYFERTLKKAMASG